MARKESVPSVEESLADPTKPEVRHRISKNLHWVLGGTVIAILTVAIVWGAHQEDAAHEAAVNKRAEADAAKPAQVGRAANVANLEEVLAEQSGSAKVGAATASPAHEVTPASLRGDAPSTQPSPAAAAVGATPPPANQSAPVASQASQASPNGSALGPVPRNSARSEPGGGGAGSAAETSAAREAATDAARREESIRASGIISLQDRPAATNGPASSGTSATRARPAASTELEEHNRTAMAGAEKTKEQLLKLVSSGAGGGSGGGAALNRPVSVQTGIDNNTNFLKNNASDQSSATTLATIKADGRVQPGVIAQHSIIPVALYQTINSDVPGDVACVVTMDVYESFPNTSRRRLLIPKGTRIMGRYNNDVRPGQERVVSAYNRLLMPNGMSVNLGGMQGYDLSGMAGMSDEVDNHFWKMFGSSFLIAGIAAVIDKYTAPETVAVNTNSASLSGAAGQTLNDVTRTILERNRNIPPTLIIKQGHKFN
ncbi:MAG: hypothetical protein E6Q40_10670, partial [Cupriavidus sp.]